MEEGPSETMELDWSAGSFAREEKLRPVRGFSLADVTTGGWEVSPTIDIATSMDINLHGYFATCMDILRSVRSLSKSGKNAKSITWEDFK